MSRVLILYTSRAGHTGRIAARIAQRLGDQAHHVDSLDVDSLPEDPDLDGYDGLLLGGSVTHGRHDRTLVALARRNQRVLRNHPSGLFSVSLAAAHPESAETTTEHVQRLAVRTGWQPDLTTRLAGDLPYTRLSRLKRYVTRRQATRLGLATDTDEDHEYTDWARVDRFADAFAALLRPARRSKGRALLAPPLRVAALAASAAAAAGGVIAYERRLRPGVRNWGATESERHRALPGDELVEHPVSTSTMAVTIDAPPTDVWPWLAQFGARRADWYSYDAFDSLGRHSPPSIMPAFQHLQEGDLVPANNRGRVALPVERLDPERHIVFGRAVDAETRAPARGRGPVNDVTWGFYLKDLPGERTRLLVRTRIGPGRVRAWNVLIARVAELVHHVRQRRHFAEIGVRAEDLLSQRADTTSSATGAIGGPGPAT